MANNGDRVSSPFRHISAVSGFSRHLAGPHGGSELVPWPAPPTAGGDGCAEDATAGGFGLCGGGAAPATGLGRDQGAVEEQLVGTWAPQLVD